MNNYVCYKIPESERENLEPLFKAYYNKKTFRHLVSMMRFELYIQYGFIWLLHNDNYELPYGIDFTGYESQIFDFSSFKDGFYHMNRIGEYSCRWASRIWRTGCGSLEIWESRHYRSKAASIIYLTPVLAVDVLNWFQINIEALEQFFERHKSKNPIIWNYKLTFEENINILTGV